MGRDVLVDLLGRGFSLDAIAARVGRSPSTVSYWLKRHGLQANGADRYSAKGGLTREQLEPLVGGGLSVREIAGALQTSPSMVRRWLARHGLQTRSARNRAESRAAIQRGDRRVLLACVRHGEVDHVLEGRGSYRCTRCRAEQVVAHRRRVKRLLIAEAGGCCKLCGYDRCVAGLQFHHLDPADKEFHLSLRGVTRSLAEIRREAAKCVLLCATCHAEVEVGFTQLGNVMHDNSDSPGWIRTTTP